FMLSDDCADALVFLMQNYSSSQPVNVGLGVDHSILEFAQIVADVVKANVSFRFNTEKPDGMLRKCSDISKLSKLGWVNKTPLKEGVQIAYQDFLRREIK
ncbi:MAG: GDP-L-fucose synthase, partial [Proteobacteria bacterium]|nr:GDP-L-fucose synthase [Pseudomonadota bacterium]